MSGMATAQYAATGFKTFHGYDISHASLEKLQAKGFQAYYWNADGGRCPMPDHTYDVIIAGEIIEHLVDTDSFAQEIHRVLKPGGYAIITTPNLASWYNRVRLLRGLPPRCYPGTSSTVRKDPLIDNHHIRINIMSEWRHFFESHRFKVVRTVGTSHLDVLAGGWKTRMLQGIDHLASRFPSLAVGLIFVVQTEPGAS
jgi:SAM-dependent methyltransferase